MDLNIYTLHRFKVKSIKVVILDCKNNYYSEGDNTMSEEKKKLTTAFGAPVPNDDDVKTAGKRGG